MKAAIARISALFDSSAQWLAEETGWSGSLRGVELFVAGIFIVAGLNVLAKQVSPDSVIFLTAARGFAVIVICFSVCFYRAAKLKGRSGWWAIAPILLSVCLYLNFFLRIFVVLSFLNFFQLPKLIATQKSAATR